MKISTLYGFLLGILLGIIARAWMRWISDDPEFTLVGTLGIVVGFGVFGAVQTFIHNFRQKERRKLITNVVRAAGVIFSLQLFLAAGAVMFPTVLLVSLSRWRTKWNKWIRLAFAFLGASIWVLIVKAAILNRFNWNATTLGRIALFAAIYIVIIRWLKPTISAVQYV